MKALTVAAKRRRKKMRTMSDEIRRLQNTPTKTGRRTKDGTLSEAKDARPHEPAGPAPAVVHRIEAYKLSEKDAKRPEAGSEHGRMYLRGQISYAGYKVADGYAIARGEWQAQLDGPRPARTADIGYRGSYKEQPGEEHPFGNPNAVQAAQSDAVEPPEDRARRIRARWDEIQAALSFSIQAAWLMNEVTTRGAELKSEQHRALFVVALQKIAHLWKYEPGEMLPGDGD